MLSEMRIGSSTNCVRSCVIANTSASNPAKQQNTNLLLVIFGTLLYK